MLSKKSASHPVCKLQVFTSKHHSAIGSVMQNSILRHSSNDSNAVGLVLKSTEHLAVGYNAHPAVVDSSMHLGVFLSAPDGHTRVPGRWLSMAACSQAFNVCLSLLSLV